MISIVIPTKARIEKVYRQIAEVNEQLKSIRTKLEIELLVVENLSSELLDPAKISQANWSIQTQSADLGGNHNFCNSILAAKGDYVWVLGDDDKLLDGTVSFMINLADNGEHDCIIVNDLGSHSVHEVPEDQKTLFSTTNNLGQLIHISGYLVRRDTFLRLCHDSILYQSTFMPQLIFALNCLRHNGLRLVDRKIFKKNISQSVVLNDLFFVSALVANGLSGLDIFIERSARKSWINLVRRTRKTWLTPKGILYEVAKYFNHDPNLRRMFFSKAIPLKHLGIFRFILYFMIGNIILSSNFLSNKYVKLYEHLRGFSINYKSTIKFYEN